MKPKYLASIGFGAIMLFIIAYIIGSAVNLERSYNHLRDPIFLMIDPGFPNHFWVAIPFLAFFSALCALAVGFFLFFPKKNKSGLRSGSVALFLAGFIGSGIILFFPSNNYEATPTNTGLYNILLISFMVILLTISIFLIGRGFGWYRHIDQLKKPSMIITFLIILCDGIAQTGWAQSTQTGGLFNRFSFLSLLVWIFLVSRMLYRLDSIMLNPTKLKNR